MGDELREPVGCHIVAYLPGGVVEFVDDVTGQRFHARDRGGGEYEMIGPVD